VSKGGWVATIIFVGINLSIIYLYLFFFYEKEHDKKLSSRIKIGLIISPVILIVIGGIFIKKSDILFAEVIKDKFEQLFDSEKALNRATSTNNPTSAQTRTLVWANTINMVSDNPLLGVGPGQWRLTYAKYGLDGFVYDIRNGRKHFQRPHNDFLWIMGETGLLGLFLYLSMYILILYVAFRNMKNTNVQVRVLNMLIFSTLLAYIIVLSVSFTRERISHNMLYLLMMMLVLVSVGNTTKEKTNKRVVANKNSIFTVVLLILLVLSIFNIKFAGDMISGDKAAKKIKIGMMRKNTPVIMRAVRSIEDSYYTLDDFAVPIPYYKGSILSSAGRYKEAKAEFKKAYNLHHYHLQTLNNLATSFDLSGDRDSALVYYKKALNISPRYEESLVNIAIVYYNLDSLQTSLNYLLKVPYSSKNPDKFNTAVMIVCKKSAQQLWDKLDVNKLKEWFYDEKKIKATFINTQQQKTTFEKVLIKEIGK
jgi:hypothetical protein